MMVAAVIVEIIRKPVSNGRDLIEINYIENRFISKKRSVQALFSYDNLGVNITYDASIVPVLLFLREYLVCFNTTCKVLQLIPRKISDARAESFVICFE